MKYRYLLLLLLLLLLSFYSHPVALAFHLLFRTGAIVVYLFGSLFSEKFPLIFIICVLLLSFDFWTVKNVTGRLLVGLRWWNDIQPDGTKNYVLKKEDFNFQNNSYFKITES